MQQTHSEISFNKEIGQGGVTEVQPQYIAKVKVDLQRYNNGWTTIQTWSNQGAMWAYVSRDYFVASGYQYRLKVTHQALNSNNNVIETHISYSRVITY